MNFTVAYSEKLVDLHTTLQNLSSVTSSYLFLLHEDFNNAEFYHMLKKQHILTYDELFEYLHIEKEEDALDHYYYELKQHILYDDEKLAKVVFFKEYSKNLITTHLPSLLNFDSILLINLAYPLGRSIEEFFYGHKQCVALLEDENWISRTIVKFDHETFVDYLLTEEELKYDQYTFEKFACSYSFYKNGYVDDSFPLLKTPSKYEHFHYRLYEELHDLVSRSPKKKNLVLYCYYEKEAYNKNQTNLQHFIQHGLQVPNTDYVFIINGRKCSVHIPSFCIVLKQDNCYDFEGWYHALNEVPWYQYKYVFFMNCSVLGPLNFDGSKNIVHNWLEPFIDKMVNGVVLCSNVITHLTDNHPGGAGPRCTSYNFLVNTMIIPLFLCQRILVGSYYNTVFSPKSNKMDAVLTGEYGLSIVLEMFKQYDYKISCLHPGITDRGQLKMSIFMKNNWIEGDNRVCLPCSYRECMAIIGKPIVEKLENYDNLACPVKGLCLDDPSYNWNSKEEFYKYFGYAEEIEEIKNS